MKVNRQAIERMQERLLECGSVSTYPRAFDDSDSVRAAAYHRARPIVEAMFLIASAGSSLDDRAIRALRGALRTLTEGELGTTATDVLLSDAAINLEQDGLDARLDRVAGFLCSNRSDLELTLTLALAAALATREKLSDAQANTFVGLATRVGYRRRQAEELLDVAHGSDISRPKQDET